MEGRCCWWMEVGTALVWYGVVWCGMAWHGMAWYGMVWFGLVWCGPNFRPLKMLFLRESALISDPKKVPFFSRCCWWMEVGTALVGFGMVWYGMVWYGMVWFGLVWFGVVWSQF